MTKTSLFALLIFVLPHSAFGQPVPGEELAKEWWANGSGKCDSYGMTCTLNAGTPMSFRNTHIDQYVHYGRRKYGIDLEWSFKDVKGISLIRPSGTLDPITYGELLALYVEGGKFLKYAEREYGINLVWSDTPVFEWKLDGGRPGRLVNSRSGVGLANTKIGQYVVYCEREYGINLKWATDCKRAPKPKSIAPHKVDVRIALSRSECASSGRVRFTLKPVLITAHTSEDYRFESGTESEYSKDVSWNNAASQGCMPLLFTRLAPGSWRINATNLIDWNTNCLVDLPILEHVRTTTVNFVLKQGGCRYQ
jgi:hypothetical protein